MKIFCEGYETVEVSQGSILPFLSVDISISLTVFTSFGDNNVPNNIKDCTIPNTVHTSTLIFLVLFLLNKDQGVGDY